MNLAELTNMHIVADRKFDNVLFECSNNPASFCVVQLLNETLHCPLFTSPRGVLKASCSESEDAWGPHDV
jgi:hypothetical protein